jgi:hypothetical protein
MAYSNFTSDDLTQRLGLTVGLAPLFRHVAPLEPGQWLLETLSRGGLTARFNEKSRSELIVAPILTRLHDFLGEQYTFYSGANLDVDPARGLNGECDFLLSRSQPLPFLQPPVMVVVEAKRGDIEAAFPQCIAQMFAARLYNEQHGRNYPSIHGALTTGDDWQFLRLTGTSLLIDPDKYRLSDLGKILGILVECLKEVDAQ